MLFRKNHKPLQEALDKLNEAVEIIHGYKRDQYYRPGEHDLHMLDLLWQQRCTLEYLMHSLARRTRRLPEPSARYIDAECFDYHYPQA